MYFIERATRRWAEQLGKELHNVPFEPYAPVRQQILNISILFGDNYPLPLATITCF